MKNSRSQQTNSLFLTTIRRIAPLIALLVLASVCYARDGQDGHQDRYARHHFNLPSELQVPAGNVLGLMVTGIGSQIYVWTVNPTNSALSNWVFKAPHAVLFGGDEGLAGIHAAGPMWQANDGSKVVGKRLSSASVNPDAIPWLLLQAASNSGSGIFADTTYIQRLETLGGLAPASAGSFNGEEVLVPYIAEYLFYHAGF